MALGVLLGAILVAFAALRMEPVADPAAEAVPASPVAPDGPSERPSWLAAVKHSGCVYGCPSVSKAP